MKNAFRSCLLALLLVVGAAASARAQAAFPALPQDPFQVILQQRQALGLTAQQMQSIRTIRAGVNQLNEQPVARFLELRRQRQQIVQAARAAGGQPDLVRLQQILGEAQPFFRRINANVRNGMVTVGNVLRPNQRQKLRELIPQLQQARPTAPAAGRAAPGAAVTPPAPDTVGG
jgi:hypothetical protein